MALDFRNSQKVNDLTLAIADHYMGGNLLNEGVSLKVDLIKIKDEAKATVKLLVDLPTSRREILADIIDEFTKNDRDAINNLEGKLAKAMGDGVKGPKLQKVLGTLGKQDQEVLATLEDIRQDFDKLISGDTKKISTFVRNMASKLNNLSDSEIKKLYKLENKIADILLEGSEWYDRNYDGNTDEGSGDDSEDVQIDRLAKQLVKQMLELNDVSGLDFYYGKPLSDEVNDKYDRMFSNKKFAIDMKNLVVKHMTAA